MRTALFSSHAHPLLKLTRLRRYYHLHIWHQICPFTSSISRRCKRFLSSGKLAPKESISLQRLVRTISHWLRKKYSKETRDTNAVLPSAANAIKTTCGKSCVNLQRRASSRRSFRTTLLVRQI